MPIKQKSPENCSFGAAWSSEKKWF